MALGLPADGFVVGWVGRMSREKGLDVLVDALPALGDLQLTVCAIGDGERASSRGGARPGACRGASRMHWAGLVAEAASYFRAFDVFVLSSRTEGVPIALLEAIAAEVPVVATRVGGVPTVVDQAQGLLVESEQPEALARAIRLVYDDRAAATVRSRAARERLLAGFGANAWLERHDEVYRSAMQIRIRSSTAG